MRPDCDHDAWYEFRPDGEHPLSMHTFVEEEVIHNVCVQVLRCTTCGKLSIGWKREPYEVEEEDDN